MAKSHQRTQRVFYRGARSLRTKHPSFWSFSPNTARVYARERDGKVFKAYIEPRKYVIGVGRNMIDSEARLARKFGVYDKWLKARQRAKTGKRSREILYGAVKKKKVDVITYSDQLVVLNPKVIHPIK